MKGKHKIVVKNNRLHYEFEIKRNITIIKGDSATGKTTLINMIRQFANLGNASGIEIECDAPCTVLEGNMWQMLLKNLSGNIIFIDEENQFIRQQEFAELVKASDNYFVIITRENLYNLPYSVEEIYGLYSSGKYQNTKQIYQEMYHIYPLNQDLSCKPDKIIVEDTNSGYEYFKAISKEKNIVCESAGGKTKIFAMLEQLKAETESICVIADGAAIGPEMDALYKMSVEKGNIKLYLPESFEWIILSSELLEDKEIKDIMDKPENYIESQEYFRVRAESRNTYTHGTYLNVRVHNFTCLVKHLHFFLGITVVGKYINLGNQIECQLISKFIYSDGFISQYLAILFVQFVHGCCTCAAGSLISSYMHTLNV